MLLSGSWIYSILLTTHITSTAVLLLPHICKYNVGALFLFHQLSSALTAWVYTHDVKGVSNEDCILSMTQIVKALCSYDSALCYHIDMLTPNIFVLLTTSGGWWEYGHKSQLKRHQQGSLYAYTHFQCQHTHINPFSHSHGKNMDGRKTHWEGKEWKMFSWC